MLENFEKYKEQYSKYVDQAVKLHNYHLTFLNRGGYVSVLLVRRGIREMIKIQRQLARLSSSAYKEIKEHKKQEQEALKAWRLANPKKKGRSKGKKSNVKHNGTNESSP